MQKLTKVVTPNNLKYKSHPQRPSNCWRWNPIQMVINGKDSIKNKASINLKEMHTINSNNNLIKIYTYGSNASRKI